MTTKNEAGTTYLLSLSLFCGGTPVGNRTQTNGTGIRHSIHWTTGACFILSLCVLSCIYIIQWVILFNEYSLDYWMKLSSKVAQKSCEVCSQSQIGHKDRAFSWNKWSLCRTIYCFMRKIPFRMYIIMFKCRFQFHQCFILNTNAFSWFISAFLSIHQCFSLNLPMLSLDSSMPSIIFIQSCLGLTLWGWSVGKRHLFVGIVPWLGQKKKSQMAGHAWWQVSDSLSM